MEHIVHSHIMQHLEGQNILFRKNSSCETQLLFADDAFLYKTISGDGDAIALQEDLNNLVKWEKNWSMEFHPDKCKVLRVTNKRKTKTDASYTIHSQKLEIVDHANLLT